MLPKPRRLSGAARLAGFLIALTSLARASIFDFSAPLTQVTAFSVGSSVTMQVNDQGGLRSTTVVSGVTFNLTNVNGVVTWSSGSTAYYFIYEPLRLAWVGGSQGFTGTTSDLTTTNGIVTWSAGGLVYSRVFDRARGVWKAHTVTSASPSGLRTVDGIVAWSSSSGTYFEAYDPLRGAWISSTVASVLPGDLRNTNGVVAWSKGNLVYSYIYDPTRNGWQGTNFNNGGTINDLKNDGGVVAWSRSPQVRFQVYDPGRGRWVGGNVNSGSTFDLSVANSTVTWTASAVAYLRGYNPVTGSWTDMPSLPLAFFAISTNAGNAPLAVSLIDMSIGGISWSWDLGNGFVTGRRSFNYLYETFGPYTITETVLNALAVPSTTNRFIVTDITPPVGTNVINTNAPFTTTNLVTLSLTASDNSGVVNFMQFSNDGANWGPLEPFAPTKQWTLAGTNGTKTVFARFADAATNRSAPATDTILYDPTPPPTVSFANMTFGESLGNASVLVTLDHSYARPVSVDWFTSDGTATAGLDYETAIGRLVFTPGQTQRSISVRVLPDLLVELDETVTLNFVNPTNSVPGPPGALTILDDDIPGIVFASTNFNVSEDGGMAAIGIRLSAASGRAVTVRCLATNGTASSSDFRATNGLITLAPGQTNASFLVPILNDTLDELSETVLLSLTNATNAQLSFPTNALLTILDDDAPTVSFSRATYAVFEDEGVAVVEVVLSKPFSQTVGAKYTAFGGSARPGGNGDYFAASGPLTFPGGIHSTSQTFFVNLVDDVTAEPDKTIHLTLSDITGARPGAYLEADILLYDDDGAPRLLEPRLTTNQLFQTTLRGKTGQVFVIETSPNLGGSWSPLRTLTNTSADGRFEFTDPQPSTNLLRRFYRTVVP